MPCRLNRLRLWQGRMLLESTQHPVSLFVTLTYDEKNVPEKGHLRPGDLKKFIKRLRKVTPVRYFAVGEYGDKSWRPHYHLALFGNSLLTADLVSRCWAVNGVSLGFSYTGLLTIQSAGYLTRYTLKRMTQAGNPLLDGRPPEFIRMSLKPGLGAPAVKTMSQNLETRRGAAMLTAQGDVTTQYKLDGKNYALGRYLSNKLREELGRPKGLPREKQLALSAEKLSRDDSNRESVRRHHSNVAKQRAGNINSKVKL